MVQRGAVEGGGPGLGIVVKRMGIDEAFMMDIDSMTWTDGFMAYPGCLWGGILYARGGEIS